MNLHLKYCSYEIVQFLLRNDKVKDLQKYVILYSIHGIGGWLGLELVLTFWRR
jgi:hypothetical protein